jgi:hypothetical protein
MKGIRKFDLGRLRALVHAFVPTRATKADQPRAIAKPIEEANAALDELMRRAQPLGMRASETIPKECWAFVRELQREAFDEGVKQSEKNIEVTHYGAHSHLLMGNLIAFRDQVYPKVGE